jgi:hypothetical protein
MLVSVTNERRIRSFVINQQFGISDWCVGYVFERPPRGRGTFQPHQVVTDRHLRAVLAEAKRVAEQYDQVAQIMSTPAHEYLRHAALRLLEGDASSIPEEASQADGVTVRYDHDQAMYDS